MARGCFDHLTTTRRRLFSNGADVMPLPADLLALGGEEFARQGRSRREFLAGGVGAMLALGAVGKLGPFELVQRALEAEAEAADAPILVTLYQNGGNDGLNTLLPLSGPDRDIYAAKRPRLAIAPEVALPVTNRPDLGWHPSAGGLKALHDAGKLSAYLGVDYPNPDQSHFQSVYYWRTAQFETGVRTGWLGNYLDRFAAPDNPLQAIAVNWGTDDLLRSQQNPSCAVFDPSVFEFWVPGVWDNQDRMLATWASLGAEARSTGRRRAHDVAAQAQQVRQALTPFRNEKPEEIPPPPVAYPDTDAGTALRNAARLLGAGLGTRVMTIDAGGMYDTHENQLEDHPKLLAELGSSLVAFQADIEARGLADRVVTLVWSEFGRRIEDNASNGTDHGSGGAVMLVGTRVKGEISDRWNLEAGDAQWDGNVPVAVDFRDVYAGLLEGHLAAPARDVIPNYSGSPLALFK